MSPPSQPSRTTAEQMAHDLHNLRMGVDGLGQQLEELNRSLGDRITTISNEIIGPPNDRESGMSIRLDRLEQESKRRNTAIAAIASAVVGIVVSGMVAAGVWIVQMIGKTKP